MVSNYLKNRKKVGELRFNTAAAHKGENFFFKTCFNSTLKMVHQMGERQSVTFDPGLNSKSFERISKLNSKGFNLTLSKAIPTVLRSIFSPLK